MTESIRIAPEPGQNAPRRALHDALCRCTECYEASKTRGRPDVTVVPFDVRSEGSRGKEPVAVLEYGGVRVEMSLTYVHNFCGSFERGSSFSDSGRIFEAALEEIETRMWEAIDREKRELNRGSP